MMDNSKVLPGLGRVAAVKHRNVGFTLIEVMIVVVVIGILSAIAYPSYQEYVRKARRADAQANLMELAQFMERHYTAQGGYLASGNSGASPTLPFTEAPKDGGTKYYDLSLSAATASAYTLQAAPKGAMAADKCGTLTYTNAGTKGQGTGGSLQECWRR